METCIFCKVVRGEIPAQVVHDDDSVVAFKDIHPQTPIHLLICPKKHIPTLNDVQPEDSALIAHMFRVARDLAKDSGIDQRGYRTVFNVNAEAGQTVFHLHMHLMGGRQLSWP